MREYFTWVLRYVPDAFRGEFINVGVLIGNDQGDWALRFVENFSRANRIGGDASSIRPFLQELHEKIYLPVQQLAFPGSDVDSQLLTPQEVENTRNDLNNIFQLSEPRISFGETAEQLAEMLFGHYVLQTEVVARGPQELTQIRKAYERALRQSTSGTPQRWASHFTAIDRYGSPARFDFAIYTEDEVDQLTMAMNFQSRDHPQLQQKINALQFTLRQVLDKGALISLDDSNISDPLEFSSHKGRLLVVHNDARTPLQQEVLRSAEQFWADIGIEHHTYNELERAPQLALAS